MQDAIPYKARATATRPMGRNLALKPDACSGNDGNDPATTSHGEEIRRVIMENGLVVFGRVDCCVSHVVKTLFLILGANPPLFEVDDGDRLLVELSGIAGGGELQFPVIFAGGELFGGLEKVVAAHVCGELVAVLRDAGALWL